MANEIEEHAPLRRQKDWETARPDESAEVAAGLGATISVRFDASSARLIRQAAKNANQTQSDFVREAAIKAIHDQVEGATAVVPDGSQLQGARPNGAQVASRSVPADRKRPSLAVVEEGS